jgi:hypothetical protein
VLLSDVRSQLLRAKILARSRAVDKVVHNLLIAARNWLARIHNLQINFCQQPSCRKTQVKSFARAAKFLLLFRCRWSQIHQHFS